MSTRASVRPPATKVDPRSARSRERVLAAAWALLREGGAQACTIEAVAAASGVAKTTIYRQFDDREDVIFAVLDMLKPTPQIPDTGDVADDVEWTLHDLAAGLFRTETSQVMASMIDLAERSERAEEMATQFGAKRRELLAARLRRAVDRGELRGDVDVELLVAQLVGPLFYRRYISRQATSRAFVSRLARTTLGPLLAPPRVPPPCRDDAGAGSPRSPR